MTEADDRNVAGFETTTPNPIEGAAQAAYAEAPIPEVPVSSFRVLGELQFADGPVNDTATKFLPRAALAYLIDQRTVVRVGAGLFSYDYFFEDINQAGFSQATPVLVTEDSGLTHTGTNLTESRAAGSWPVPTSSNRGSR